jgi:hypothetical protein
MPQRRGGSPEQDGFERAARILHSRRGRQAAQSKQGWGEGTGVSAQQRANPRTSFGGWVELHVDGARRLAAGRDLSARGIGLELTGDPIPALARVTCEFALPGISLPLELEGSVAWSQGSRLGVRFDEVDPGLAELLDNHVAGRI